MSALLQQHDRFCRCRSCKPPLSPIAQDEAQARAALLLGGGVLVTAVGALAGVSVGLLGWR